MTIGVLPESNWEKIVIRDRDQFNIYTHSIN